MATKAQRFKARQERASRPAQSKKPRRPRRDVPVDTSQPGVSATDRKVGGGRSGTRNLSARAGRKGGASLEDSATGRPSRKSTRKSTGSVKRTSNLRQREVRRVSSPKAKAARNRAAQ